MRMAFGILSLLVSVAIMLYLMVGTGYMGNVAKQNKAMKAQVNVLAGNSADGSVRATDSIVLRVEGSGSRPKLIVASVAPAGPMEERYGLVAGDRIVEIGQLDFEMNIQTRDAAEAHLHDAYARQWPLTIVRNGQRLTLPTPEHVAMIADQDRKAALAAAGVNPNTPAPTPAAPPVQQEKNPLQGMLDALNP